MIDLKRLDTEKKNPASAHIDELSPLDMMRVIHAEDQKAVDAVTPLLPKIAETADKIARRIRLGGRLLYCGAGTSGRLGVLDASEACPTFGVPEGTIVGVMAGGVEALHRAGEPEEDSAKFGVRDLKAIDLAPADCVVGVSAAGGAEYVLAAVEYAKSLGCATIGLTCNDGSPLAQLVDIAVVTDTGAEVVTGSTRMKAGTAHKLVLNMLSTCSMVHLGNVYENMMVNLKPTNAKLKERMVGIVAEIRKTGRDEARRLLDGAGWNIRAAVRL